MFMSILHLWTWTMFRDIWGGMVMTAKAGQVSVCRVGRVWRVGGSVTGTAATSEIGSGSSGNSVSGINLDSDLTSGIHLNSGINFVSGMDLDLNLDFDSYLVLYSDSGLEFTVPRWQRVKTQRPLSLPTVSFFVLLFSVHTVVCHVCLACLNPRSSIIVGRPY